MAFVIKRVTVRASANRPFALGSPRLRANPQFQKFFELRKAAPGFLGMTRTLSDDKLTVTTETRWETREHAVAFKKKYPRLTKAVMRMMGGYNKNNSMRSRSTVVV
jgi:heme-degrading monooxygenase HmoA